MNNELYHFGVKGMKWGVRRAQKQLGNLTERHHTQVSEQEARKFRGDVGIVKNIKSKSDRQSYVISNTTALGGKKHAEAVLRQANKEHASSFARKALVTAGIAAVASYPVRLAYRFRAAVNS